MKGEMVKTERLLYILFALLAKKKIIAKDIAESLQVSVRTVYRDIESLSLAGIPIYSERGNDGGFFIAEQFKMQTSLFTEAEQQFLRNISSNINQMVSNPLFDLLDNKLDYYHASDDLAGNYYFDLNSWDLDTSNLALLDKALTSHVKVSFKYYGKLSGQVKRRQVVPCHLIFKLNSWYLLAWCLEADDYRSFKLTRMKELELQESFDPRLSPKLSLRELDKKINPSISFPKEKLVLSFDQVSLPFVYDAFAEEEVTLKGKRVEVRAERWIGPEFYRLLLGFGCQLEVVEPQSLRDKILDDLQKNLSQYDS